MNSRSDAPGHSWHCLLRRLDQLSEEAFLRDFAGDLSPEEARTLYAVQQPFKKSLTAEKATHAAWRTKLTFYAVSTQDRTINPELQRFMAKRMGAKTIEIEASHLALISHPDAALAV